jgi:glutamine synthetase
MTKTGVSARISPASDDATGAVGEVLATLRARDVRFAELWFTELSGRPRRVAIVAEQVGEPLFSAGVTLDGPSTGRAAEGSFRILPDPAAVYLDPVASTPTLAIFGDAAVLGAADPHALDPRRVLARAEAHLRRTGVAERCVVGAEPEYFVLAPDGTAAGEEVVWAHLRRMATALRAAGIEVDGFRTGPAAGQGRVQMRAAPAGRLADQVMLYRYFARSVAEACGHTVSFLSRPLPGRGSGGMPVHHALWRGGANLFHEAGGWAATSALCRWYAGGLLRHAPALMALCAPTTNAYRRLVTDGAAPTAPVLSRDRGAAVCRIPARSAAAAARRIKFRSPDAGANPYLAFAAMLMAGLDGVEQRLEPPRDDAGAPPAGPLPRSLDEALDALEHDHAFLTRGGVFGAELIRAWIDDRRRNQVLPVRAHPHPEERRLEEQA